MAGCLDDGLKLAVPSSECYSSPQVPKSDVDLAKAPIVSGATASGYAPIHKHGLVLRR